jgi:hypothetical protein
LFDSFFAGMLSSYRRVGDIPREKSAADVLAAQQGMLCVIVTGKN